MSESLNTGVGVPAGPDRFQARPFKVRVFASVAAVIVLAVFVVVALLLRRDGTGVSFYLSDQIAMVGVGVVLAGGAMLWARPRVRADREGIEVRNVLMAKRFAWRDIELTFPDGSAWARVELPDDEYVPVLAVQAIDGDRAVTAMRELRRLRRESLAD